MIACYCRVSTDEQNLDRQLEATHEYATDRLGAEPSEIETYRDKSTGTDTARDGYQDMMQDASEHDIRAVVVSSTSRIARSIRDLDRTVDRLGEHGTALHMIDEGLVIEPGEDDPFQRALFQLLGVFAELEANMAQQRTREGIAARQQNDEYHHGPAPLGFEKDDGRLIEGPDYDRVTTVLELVAKGEKSKRQAAKDLNTTRTTVRTAIQERGELYGL